MKKSVILFVCMVALATFAAWAPQTEANNNFGACESCHGGFLDADYISNTAQDGVAWVAPVVTGVGKVNSLHEGHAAMVNGSCSACHSTVGDKPLLGGPSGDGLGSCVGCHGRVEDNNGGEIGAGLRQHHENNGMVGTCNGCHSDNDPATFTTVGENVPGARNVALGIDPCADAFFGIFGSDNDGDNLYDGDDSDCAAANQPPVAADDAYAANEDTLLTTAAPGVLDNDTDADGDPLTVVVLNTDVSFGTLTLNSDGSFSYLPKLNFFGTDIFTYVASDGVDNSNTTTVTITVIAVNDPPVSNPNGPYMGTTGSSVSFDGSGSSDTEGTITSYTWDFGDGSTGTGVDPAHTYAGHGLFNVTLTVEDDGGNTDTAATTADISAVPNILPVAVNDVYTTDEDTPLNVATPGVLTNDTDANSDLLEAFLKIGVSNGTLTLNTDGSFNYVPNVNFSGSDTFTYVAYDGMADSNIATVTITVNSVNDSPVSDPNGPYTGTAGSQISFDGSGSSDVDGTIVSYAWNFGDGSTGTGINPINTYATADSFTVTLTVADDLGATDTSATTADIIDIPNTPPVAIDDAYDTDEDTSLNVAAPGVLANDTDADGDPLNVSLIAGAGNGTLALNPDGSLNYMPDVNFSGPDTFSYQVNDGMDNSNIVIVTISVNGVNDQPMAVDNNYTTPQDTMLTVSAPGVLGNDSDPEGDSLTAKLNSDVAGGTLALNTDGSFTYMPNAGFTGPDSFTYVANDGLLDSNVVTVMISVQAGPNRPPVAVDDTAATPEETPVTIDVLANDSDPDGDPLTVVAVSGTAVVNGDGTVTYTPNTNFTGTDSFTYTMKDGQGAGSTATVTVNVTPVNDLPVANDDDYSTSTDSMLTVATPGVLGNDVDPDSDTLTASLVSDVTNGILSMNEDGSFDYTPDPGFTGSDTFTYVANDGLVDSSEATVTITVQTVEVPVCDDGSIPVITEMEYNQGDEKLHIKGRSTTGTTITIINADTDEILQEGIMVREGKWEAEIKDVGSTLENITVMTSSGCAVNQEIEGHKDSEDSEDSEEEAEAADDDRDKRKKDRGKKKK